MVCRVPLTSAMDGKLRRAGDGFLHLDMNLKTAQLGGNPSRYCGASKARNIKNN